MMILFVFVQLSPKQMTNNEQLLREREKKVRNKGWFKERGTTINLVFVWNLILSCPNTTTPTLPYTHKHTNTTHKHTHKNTMSTGKFGFKTMKDATLRTKHKVLKKRERRTLKTIAFPFFFPPFLSFF